MSKFTQPVLDRDYDEIVRLLIEEFKPELMKDNAAGHNLFIFNVVGTEIEVRFEVGDDKKYFSYRKKYNTPDEIKKNNEKPDFVFLILLKYRFEMIADEKERIMIDCKFCLERMKKTDEIYLERQNKIWSDLWDDNCRICNNKLEENTPELDRKMGMRLAKQIMNEMIYQDPFGVSAYEIMKTKIMQNRNE